MLALAGAFVAPFAVTAVWLRLELLSTPHYVALVAPLARNAAIDDAVATAVSDELVGALGGTSGLDGSVRAKTETVVAASLRTEAFQHLWVEANRRAHEQFLAEAERPPAVAPQDGAFVVDLSALVAPAEQALASAGLTIFDREAQQLIRPKLVLAKGSSGRGLRRAVRVLKVAAVALPVAAASLLAAAVALARRRARIVAVAGMLVALSAGAALGAVYAGRWAYLHEIVAPAVPRAAALAVYDTLLSGLRLWLAATCGAGAVAAAAGLLLLRRARR